MMELVIQLDELTCPSCMQKIKSAFQRQRGVRGVRVLYNASKVKADIDSEVIQPKDLSALLEKLGFHVQSVKIRKGA